MGDRKAPIPAPVNMAVQLGDLVRDSVTGFEGVAVSITRYLQGCRRVGVQSRKLIDGKPGDWQTFDEPQLTVTKSAVVPTVGNALVG